MKAKNRLSLWFIVATLTTLVISSFAAEKKIVLIAGSGSHGSGAHEFRAGCLLLKKCLDQVQGVKTEVHFNGWPAENAAFEGADTLFIYCDGGNGHPAIKQERLELLRGLMRKGVGLGCAHYAVEVPKGDPGQAWLEWIGGYFEMFWSVNPHWTADFASLPVHPVTRGVKPFKIRDEWYYHMRFPEGMKGITPILTAIAPTNTLSRPDGPHSGNPAVRKAVLAGEPQHVMWCTERADGGRGFGFTGAHFHRNWANDDFRKVILNAILWSAKVEVPSAGVESKVTPEELAQGLEPKDGGKPTAKKAAPGSAGDTRGSGPEAAKEDLRTMTGGEGLAVTLFASEPMVKNPANMDIDARGRVWVTEGVNYRVSKRMDKPWGVLQPEGDRIVILEDTDRDGAADKAKTFYQGMDVNTAMGICVLGNKVIVSSSPNVFVLTDTDGDDKADKKEVLFTDSSQGDHDHTIHAFVFGPDGKLYFNFGNEVKQLLKPDGKPVSDLAGNEVTASGKPYRQGMVLRCNPDGSDLETLAWNFRNSYEVCVDSFGTLWQSDNDDDGNRGVRINFVMEYGNYGFRDEVTGAGWSTAWKIAQEKGASESEKPLYHWHQHDPGVVPNLLVTGNGSPTGICIYEGHLLPQRFRNQIIHCDAGPRVVRAYPITNDGAGYTADTINILTSSDTWYRPSDVCVAPDGSLLIADWFDPGVGGHNMGDRDAEKMRGRIYRVAPKGRTYSAPKLDLSSPAEAVKVLQSPNLATRYLAWTKLHGWQGKAEKALLKLWKEQDPRFRARALHLLARIPGQEKKYVRAAAKDKDPDIRITGLRVARSLKMDVIPYVTMLVKDPSAQVRREAAIALRHNVSPAAAELWAQLAQQHDGQDRWYLEALGIAADRQENKFFEAWLAVVGDQWNTAAGRDIIWRSRSNKTPALLVKIITDKNTPEKERARYLRSLDFISGPEKDAALVELVTAGAN